MKVAIGFKPHSGWAVLVALGRSTSGSLTLVDRRRVELVDPGEHWARQPYHAAEQARRELPEGQDEARRIVSRGIRSAQRLAAREVRRAIDRLTAEAHEVAACAVLVADPMPDWSVDDILSVHFRMHKAEGVLFREALARGAEDSGVSIVRVLERTLSSESARRLGATARARIAALRRTCGPPWGQDQKDAALAAWIALAG